MLNVKAIIPGTNDAFEFIAPEGVDISEWTMFLHFRNQLTEGDVVVIEAGPDKHEYDEETGLWQTHFDMAPADTSQLTPTSAWVELKYCDAAGKKGYVWLGDRDGAQQIPVGYSLKDITCPEE